MATEHVSHRMMPATIDSRNRMSTASSAAPLADAPRVSSAGWPTRYASRLFYSDVVVIVVTLLCYALTVLDGLGEIVSWPGGPFIPYWAILVVVGVVWLTALDAIDTRDRHTVGQGVIEYRRIVNATLAVFALVVTICFFARIDLARSLFIIAFPIGLVLLLTSRWFWRQWLRAQQQAGRYLHRAVVIGERSKVEHVIGSIERATGSGFEIVGVITNTPDARLRGIPVVGDLGSPGAAVGAIAGDTLIVAGSDDLDPMTMRRLGWAVADRDGQLVVAPALTDVAGPRIHTRPVAGLPLVHVEFPRLDGYKRFAKRAFDIIGSALLIAGFSPILLATAIAIRMDGPGPIFYRQTRIGRRGREFGMRKFRSMVANADDQLASLLDVQGTTDQPLFKVTNDPRITKVGRFLRKHSIDELPQLFNVFLGEMSLVGPRPQRAAEVALYDDDAHRRLLVKPGMSGLWQVSGRSKLSWEDALRLDLYYVENWSFTQDIQILFRTVKAVVAPGETAH